MEKLVKKILDQFGQFTWKKFSTFTRWLDHRVVIFENNVIFRFPRTTQYKEKFTGEIEFLRDFFSLTPVKIPQYIFIWEKSSFAGYTMIQWDEFTAKIFSWISQEDKKIISQQLAEFLSALHQYNYAKMNLKFESQKKLFLSLRLRMKRYIYPKINLEFKKIIEKYLEWSFVLTRNPQISRVLVHNDLTSEHIFLWKKNTIWVIDFSDRCITDPAIDFAWLYEYWETFVRSVYDVYTWPKDEMFLQRAFTYYVRIPLWMALENIQNEAIFITHMQDFLFRLNRVSYV